ncbi:MAG: formyltransferase family protein [Polaromonas sp.]
MLWRFAETSRMVRHMKVCIAGKNEIAVQGLELAIAILGRENVVVCPNVSDDGASRWQPSLIRFAREWGVKVLELDDLYALDDLIFISLEFDRIVRPDRFRTKRLFNIHFSRLPAYKGMYTSAWPILNGEKHAGVTLHKIDAGIDTGDIIDQTEIEIHEKCTARELYYEYLRSANLLLNRCFRALIEDNYVSKPQASAGSSYYSKTSISYANISIDLRSTAESVSRQVRAFHFREFQIPHIDRFPVVNGQIQGNRSRGAVGRVTSDGTDAIVVSTIDFDIRFGRDKSWDFFRLVAESDVAGVIKFFDHRKFINVTNANGWTPLMIAAYQGNESMCRALIDAGADVHKSNQNGTTVLMYAKDYGIRMGDFSLCKLLQDAGCDRFAHDRFGKTVIDYARMKQDTAAIKFFGTREKCLVNAESSIYRKLQTGAEF